MSEMMKRIYEVIKRREELESNKEVKKELLYKLNNENSIIITNSDEDYEYYKGDMNYYNELIVSTQSLILRLTNNLLHEQ